MNRLLLWAFALLVVAFGVSYVWNDRFFNQQHAPMTSGAESTPPPMLSQNQPPAQVAHQEVVVDTIVEDLNERDPYEEYLAMIDQYFIPGTRDGSHEYFRLDDNYQPVYSNTELEEKLEHRDAAAAFVLANRAKNNPVRRRELIVKSVAWSGMPGALVYSARDLENYPGNPDAMKMQYAQYEVAIIMNVDVGEYWHLNRRTKKRKLGELGVSEADLNNLIIQLMAEIDEAASTTDATSTGGQS